uniref:MIF4G domain-containing protein n=2 Tax=Caenorhabditis tropicalis TaxID=1561998 RepID=A0A1I7UY74_9PELO
MQQQRLFKAQHKIFKVTVRDHQMPLKTSLIPEIPVNSTGAPSSISSTTNTMGTSFSQHNQSQSQPSHQRHSSTSSSSQQPSFSKQPMKKHNEVEKILLQMNNSAGSQSSQGGFRSAGNKDLKGREKEKEKNQSSSRQGNQTNHHHQHSNHNSGGGASSINQQNNRKKDNKFQNRDLSNNSHRGGYINNYGNHYPQQQQQLANSLENHKSSGFPSNTSLSSAGIVSASPTPVPPAVTPVCHESKTVQTEEKPKRTKQAKKEKESSPFKTTNPKDMDTVLAFKEHDDWNKVELMCELIYLLSPTDLRLLLNCIEGSVRYYANQMRPVEKTSNCADPTAGLPQFVCYPLNQQQNCFVNAHDPSTHIQRAALNMFGQQFPPGLPPLMNPGANVVYPCDSNYNHPPSSQTPPSSCSAVNNEATNGTTQDPAISNNTPPAEQQQEPSRNSTKSTTVTATMDKPPATVSESDATYNAVINLAPSSSSSMQQSFPTVPQEPEKFLKSVRDLTSYLYTLMSVCTPTNRKSASKISDYFKAVLLREKTEILNRIPDELDKIDVLQDIGKIISAFTHHPAVTLDDKMKYADMRNGLRAEIESLFRLYYSPEKQSERKQQSNMSDNGKNVEEGEDSDDSEEDEQYKIPEYDHAETSSKSAPGTFFVTRFIGRQVEKSDDLFSLEIHWSDGDRTFAQRSRDQLKTLQHRLLDEFGQQRSEKYNSHHGTTSSFSSFDEDNRKLSASTSTMETAFVPTGDRIVPRLARDATSAQYIQYINELSDLPARMMLSSVICEEFNGTRSRSDDESRDLSDGLIFQDGRTHMLNPPFAISNVMRQGASTQ